MKRFIITITALICLLMLSGCAKESGTEVPGSSSSPVPDPLAYVDEADIKDGRHPREEGWKNPFDTRFIDTPLAEVHVENGGGSDSDLLSLAGTVVSDIRTISSFTGEEPRKIAVYAVNNLLRDRALPLDDHLFCTAADIESGAYREALIGACFDVPEVWKQVGLAELIFGEPDESGLNEYYSDEAHALTASCAAVYFVEGVADEETVRAARQTAASITAFILDTGGFDALKAAQSTAEALPAWAEKLGFDAPVLPEGNAETAAMTAYKDRIPSRLCVMQIGNITMTVKKGAFAQTADELYAFACRFFVGADIVLRQIGEEAPFLSDIANEHFRAPFTINLLDDPTQSGLSTTWGDTIDLRYESSVWHELVHWLLWKGDDDTSTMWLQESAAEHFSNYAMSLARQIPYDEDEEREYYNTADLSDRDRSFYLQCMELYLKEREKDPGIPTEIVNYQRLRGSYAICSLLLQYDPMENYAGASLAVARGMKAGQKAKDPTALSYYEAALLLDYLFDTCGSENVMRGYWDNTPLKDICGMDYPELYQDFIASLREEYGEFFSDPEQ